MPMAALFADVAAKSSSVAIKSKYKTAFWEETQYASPDGAATQ